MFMYLSSTTQAQRSTILYNALIVIRVSVATLLPGYIHPDEFFQGGQELWFGCPPTRPWEFESNNALRSVVPPTIMTWLPLQLCSAILAVPVDHLSGWYVWVIPRVACAITSIVAVDWSVWALVRLNHHEEVITTTPSTQAVPLPVLMIASAWPTMVLLNRPFTNSMETWILAVLFRISLSQAHSSKPTISNPQCLAVGFLLAFGIFTRFTFAFFAFPIMVHFGFKIMTQLSIFGCLTKAIVTILTFILVASTILNRDTEFYSSTSLVITPWNAFSYNSKVENLQHHGLHPRWTHVLVNMFLLYGPMTIGAYIYFGMTAFSWLNARATNLVDARLSHTTLRAISSCSQWTIIFSLAMLSSAPHQEPRFLLPLLIPLAILSLNTKSWENYQGYLSAVWIVFNVTLLVFFGLMHQSGIIPSLLAMGTTLADRNPKAVLFYHTYMPPTFASRLGLNKRHCKVADDTSCHDYACKDFSILDLDGTNNLSSLHATISEKLRCDEEPTYIYLVSSPFSETQDEESWYVGAERCNIPGYVCKSIWSHSPHFSTEDWGSLTLVAREGLPLSIYEISC